MEIVSDILDYWEESAGIELSAEERVEAILFLEEDAQCGFMESAVNGIPIGEHVLHVIPDTFFTVIPNARKQTAEAIKDWVGVDNAIPFDYYGAYDLHYLGW